MTQTSLQKPTLRKRALIAGAWTLGAHSVDQAISLLSNLVMTRLLFPEAFGVVAAATALILGLTLITDCGIHAVIVQSPRGERDDFLRSAWVFQLWRGMVIWILLATSCALISIPSIQRLFPNGSVFAEPSFPLITAVMGVGVVFNGAESTTIFLNLRRLNLKPIVILGFLARGLSLPIMIIWALVSPSVWALIGGALAGGALRLILSHIIVPGPRMGLKWDSNHIQEIVRFGKWIVISSLASFVIGQSDILLLGLLLPSSTLGIYSIAKTLLSAAEGILNRLNTNMALPILGEVIRRDPRDLRNRYYRFRLPIDLAAALLSGVVIATGTLIIGILYDPRYSEAGMMLQILAIGAALYPFHLIGTAFTATGDTHVVASVTIIQAVAMIAGAAIGYATFGLFGALFGIAIHRLLPSAVIMLLAHKRGWISIWHELRIFPFFIFAIIIGEGIVMVAEALGIPARRLWH